MKISQIHIENIRGFEKVSLNVDLRPNCTNILVAPNGFGKSSISTAFNCAKGKTLNIEEKDKHKKSESAISVLKIDYNGIILTANSQKNEISEIFDVHVIKSNIEPKAKLPKINGFTIAKPYLEISSIDLGPTCDRENLNFQLSVFKSEFGANSKVIPNLNSKCNDERLRSELLDVFGSIEKLKQRRYSNFFRELIENIRISSGTKASISNELEAKYTDRIQELPHLREVIDILVRYNDGRSWLDNVIISYLLMRQITVDRQNLKNWLLYADYLRRLQSSKDFIADINGAWVAAEIKETKGRIRVTFPDASSLSNGQRDLLQFGCNLLRAREILKAKPCILFIDEVFDYLDDANIVVAQYFISNLIESYRRDGREIYVCLLTHLDPLYFKGYALKRQQTVYLGIAPQKITETMRKVILSRDEGLWTNELSRYFLHYHPENCDIQEVFNSHYGLPKKHGQSHKFYEFLREEWDKCVSSSGSYDPFAVTAYVRVQIERCAYSKIEAQADRDTFLDKCHGTANKLEFAESLGITVPEACLLLGVVYNDAMHRKGAIDQSSSIALKLRNIGLQSMMRKAVDW